MSFYTKLFVVALSLVTRRGAKEKEQFQNLLFDSEADFLKEVIKEHEAKNTNEAYKSHIKFTSSFVKV